MEANGLSGRYHRFRRTKAVNLILWEIVPREYVWMSIFLKRSLRNGVICKELIRYVLGRLAGTHHIHFFPKIRSLAEMADECGWRYQGKSRFFSQCVAYCASGLAEPSPLSPLFDMLLEYGIVSSRPHFSSFVTSREATRTVVLIRDQFADHVQSNGQRTRVDGGHRNRRSPV